KGIDVADPANTNVYEATINLFFVPFNTGTDPSPSQEEPLRLEITPTGVQCVNGCRIDGPPVSSCDVTDPAGKCFLLGGYTFTPSVQYVDGQPIIQWLVIPVRASFLKEFFDVRLIVQNLAPAPFKF